MIEAALSMAKVQFAHNRWADETLFAFLPTMPAEQYQQTPCSGNGTIAATVAHLVLVQVAWMNYFSGKSSLPEAIQMVMNEPALPDAAAVRARWQSVDEETSTFLDGLTDEAFVTERSFSLPGGTPSSLPLWEILLSLTTHGVHTRGQIVSAIRETGVKPPELGFLRFCMETRKASVAEDEEEE